MVLCYAAENTRQRKLLQRVGETFREQGHVVRSRFMEQVYKLDFVQLRRIAERFREALQQCAWYFNHIGLLLGH